MGLEHLTSETQPVHFKLKQTNVKIFKTLIDSVQRIKF